MGIFRGEIILQKCFSSCLFLQSLSCLPILCTIFWPGIYSSIYRESGTIFKKKNRIYIIFYMYSAEGPFWPTIILCSYKKIFFLFIPIIKMYAQIIKNTHKKEDREIICQITHIQIFFKQNYFPIVLKNDQLSSNFYFCSPAMQYKSFKTTFQIGK